MSASADESREGKSHHRYSEIGRGEVIIDNLNEWSVSADDIYANLGPIQCMFVFAYMAHQLFERLNLHEISRIRKESGNRITSSGAVTWYLELANGDCRMPTGDTRLSPNVFGLFCWYAVTMVNFVDSLFAVAVLSGNVSKESKITYRRGVLGPILSFRDKVAAHVAGNTRHKLDTDTERYWSHYQAFARWDSQQYWVPAATFSWKTVQDDEERAASLEPWSLTFSHRRFANRFWVKDPDKSGVENNVPECPIPDNYTSRSMKLGSGPSTKTSTISIPINNPKPWPWAQIR